VGKVRQAASLSKKCQQKQPQQAASLLKKTLEAV